MKHAILAGIWLWLLLPSAAQAGDGRSREVQAGYGVFRADGEDVGRPYHLYGWDASLTHFYTPGLGLTARVSSGYGNVRYREEIIGTAAYGFLIGPTFKRRRETFEPFVHALFAGLLIRADRGTYTATGLEFGAALGGGVDCRLTRGLALRMVQFDYLAVRAEGMTLHNFKLGAGLVLGF